MTPGGGAAGDHQNTKPDSANRVPFESLLTRLNEPDHRGGVRMDADSPFNGLIGPFRRMISADPPHRPS